MAITEAVVANKLQLAIAGIVVLGGAGATYVALGGDLPFLSQNQMADKVPKDVDMVVYMDPGIAKDKTTKELVNGMIDIAKDKEGDFYPGPDDYEAMMDQAESNSSLKMADLNSIMLYAKYPDATGDNSSSVKPTGLAKDSYLGFIIDSDWSEQQFINESEGNGTSYEKDEYQGHTVYVEQNVSDDQPPGWIGVLGDGQYVLGTKAAVKDAIDVDRGKMQSFHGELRTAYDDTKDSDNTYLKFAASFPDEKQLQQVENASGQDQLSSNQQFSAFKNIQVVSGSYYTNDETIGMQMRLETTNTDDADDLDSIVDGGITIVKQDATTNESRNLLDQVEVEQDGTAVKITFESQASTVVDAWTAAADEWNGLGIGASGSAGYGTSSSYNAVDPAQQRARSRVNPVPGKK